MKQKYTKFKFYCVKCFTLYDCIIDEKNKVVVTAIKKTSHKDKVKE